MLANSEVRGAVRLADVCREVATGWAPEDYRRLREELSTYTMWVGEFLRSGEALPSHIEGSGGIAVPICKEVTPEQLFAVLGESVRYQVREYRDYWVTVHYPNPQPVVTLLPKALPGPPRKLEELCARCGELLGVPVGGPDGMFLAWLLPGFSWAMHTDHDNAYELVATRVHVPLITNPQSLYVWGHRRQDGGEVWEVCEHLEAGKAYRVRVDVPHTVVNRHATEPRLHLILDVREK